MPYTISKIYPSDKYNLRKIDQLLEQEGIMRDGHLDYTCAIFNDHDHIIATGSCFGNTLRCLSVDHRYQGEGLLNQIITHLIQVQYERGNTHLFLYTKVSTAQFFADLGFYEITTLPNQLVFMENKKNGFKDYLTSLEKSPADHKKIAALVINANPFTLGHQYLIETAAAENDSVHVFIVSEDASLVPFAVRKQLALAGTAHLDNVIYHDTCNYIISRATFPSYFLKDEVHVIESQARVDVNIFVQIAKQLHISKRYVGEEPTSLVTGIYNHILQEELAKADIDCCILPRKTTAIGQVISASTVRQAIQDGKLDLLKDFLPQTSLDYFLSPEAEPVITKIQQEKHVKHY